MNPNLQNVLADLATKLGTSVSNLWPVLVANARVKAIVSLVGFGVISLTLFIGTYFACRLAKRPKYDDLYILAIMLIILGCIIASFSIGKIPDVMYPEAEALRSLRALL